MPGFLLTTGATVMCAHGGQATATGPVARVRAGGQPVAAQPSPHSVAGCPFTPANGGNGPCVTGQWVTAATRVRAGGMPVLLQDSRSVCTPTGTPLTVAATQTRVRGM